MRGIARLVFFLIALFPAAARAEGEGFAAWLQELEREAVASGIPESTVRNALSGITFDESVIELDRKQPEKTITFSEYVSNVLSPPRIRKGREIMRSHKKLLREIESGYGVPASIIVALWGIESSFGSNSGDYGVLESLATLAYEGRRAGFFRNELLEALRLINEERLDPYLLRGSWAGAMGQCQFMPSVFRRHAVDYDGDGRRDIWENEADILASIASYLAAEGWQRGKKWGRETTASGARGHAQPASLVQPDGPGGRSFLVYDNFRVLMRWNRSTYFAISAGLLADKLVAGN